jgi:hypothetical protein
LIYDEVSLSSDYVTACRLAHLRSLDKLLDYGFAEAGLAAAN